MMRRLRFAAISLVALLQACLAAPAPAQTLSGPPGRVPQLLPGPGLIDSSGNIVAGSAAAQIGAGASTPEIQASGAVIGLGSFRWNAGTGGGNLQLLHSRSNTVGTQTALQSGDTIGTVTFSGSDGTNFINNGASIAGAVDGAVSAGVTPGRLSFSTMTAGGASTEAVRIDSAQNMLAGKGLQVGSLTSLTLAAGEQGFARITASGTAPGAAGAKMEWVCGTAAGSMKLIAYAGTSTTPVTIIDNVGSGGTGC